MSADIKGESLVGMVDYQDGSIVSKTILKNKAGTITLFAFDRGQAMSEHTAPYDATVVVLDGRAEILISGHPITLEAGEMVIMPADEPHALSAVDRFKMMLVMIKSS